MRPGWRSSDSRGSCSSLPMWGGSVSQLHHALKLCAPHRGIDNLLSNPADAKADWTFEWIAPLQRVDQVLDRILIRRHDGRGRNSVRHRFLARLDRRVVVVVIAADRPLGAGDHKAALRLWLRRPRIGERAPARFK